MTTNKTKPVLKFHPLTHTIRQHPGNYLIAHKDKGRWICEPDLACNKDLAIRVFTELLNYNSKYGPDSVIINALDLVIRRNNWKLHL